MTDQNSVRFFVLCTFLKEVMQSGVSARTDGEKTIE